MGSNYVRFVHWCVYNTQSSGPHQNCLGVSKEGSHLNRHEVNRLQPRAEPTPLIHTNTNMYILTCTYTVIRTYLYTYILTCLCHTYIHVHMYTLTCAHTNAFIYRFAPLHTHSHTHRHPSCICTSIYRHILRCIPPTLMHTHLYTLIHYTHSHMLAHTHTQRKS